MATTPVLKEVEYCKDVPEPRSGHRSCATSNHLIIYGGYRDLGHEIFSDIICYNTISKKWTKVPGSGNVRLESASCSMLLHLGSLIIFGGSGFPFGLTNSNNLSSFSLSKQKWLELDGGKSLNAPTAKYGQSMALSVKDQRIYIFSGTTGSEFVDEMHYFDFAEKSWHRLHCENQPQARYRHEVVTDNEYFYVLGGAITRFAFGFEEIYRFSFINHEWSKLACQPSQDAKYPLPRRHHSCVLHKNIVYMCGGQTAGLVALDDIWMLNLDNLTWSMFHYSLPRPLFFHSAAVAPDGCMFIFGGVINLNERTSALYELWLEVPSLLKLCFRFIIEKTCQKQDNKYLILKDMGIPSILLDRMFIEIPAG